MAPTFQTTTNETRTVWGQAEPKDAQHRIDHPDDSPEKTQTVRTHLIPPQEEKIRLQEKGMFLRFLTSVVKTNKVLLSQGQHHWTKVRSSTFLQKRRMLSRLAHSLTFYLLRRTAIAGLGARTSERLARTLDEPQDAVQGKVIFDAMRAGAAGVTGEDLGLEELRGSSQSS